MKCLLSKNSRHRFFYNCLSKILSKLLYTHPLLGARVVSGEELQLVVAICDEGSGLILGE
jgi:hypothetical protein